MKNKNEIEILAPAGSLDRMMAAFSGGADACYIGGKSFGARAFADNPDEKDLVYAIDYAHLRRKKLFLTINTLLKENELQNRLYDYVLPYYEAGIDAVLVQDFGVMRFLHHHFPDLPLHASTQMSVCNLGAVEELKKYDIKRLVLARELSLSEIADFKKSGMEIECFVHGALCVCYSGQCSMSYFNGGRSGNRGSCAGSCRMPYRLYEGETKNGGPFGRVLQGGPYLLSPKDMCAIDFIPEMHEAGVYSFKIEGRMKRSEYAALTAFLYRKWSDIYLKEGKKRFHSKEAVRDRKKDIEKLSDLYNRGSFTEGYLFLHNNKEMMADKRPNHNGVLVGVVKQVGSKTKKNVMTIKNHKELYPQDVLEIRDEKDPATPVYEFTLKEGFLPEEGLTSNFTAGLKVREGLSVYRTKNDKLLKEIGTTILEKEGKIPIEAVFTAEVSKPLSLKLTADGHEVTVFGEVALKAENKPVERERIEKSLQKLGDTAFVLSSENLNLSVGEDVFFPMSGLNVLRRNAAKKLEEALLSVCRRKAVKMKEEERGLIQEEEKTPLRMIVLSSPEQADFFLRKMEDEIPSFEWAFNMELFPRGAVFKYVTLFSKYRVRLFLRLPALFRKEVEGLYSTYFDTEKGRSVLDKLDGFLLRNPESLSFVKTLSLREGRSFELIGDFNLHVFNSRAAEALYEMGISSYTASLEQTFEEKRQVRNGLRVPSGLNFLIYGRTELMVTAQCQWKNKDKCVKELKKGEKPLSELLYLENFKGHSGRGDKKYPVAKNCEFCQNMIYMNQPLDFFAETEELERLKPHRIRIDLTFEKETEIREVMKLAKFGE